MNNTHKLLLAFIEASGYEVEEVPTKGSVIARDAFIAAGCAFDPPLKYNYKVTKKAEKKGDCPHCKGKGGQASHKVFVECPYCCGNGRLEAAATAERARRASELLTLQTGAELYEKFKNHRKQNYETALDAEYAAGAISYYEYMGRKASL